MVSRLQSTETAIDHLGVVGTDIAAMRSAYIRLGFTVTQATPLMQPGPDGKGEVSLGQVSAHIVFPDTYLELSAVRHPGQGNHLDSWLARHEGLHILALRSGDAAQSLSDLIAAGLVMPPLRAASRVVTAGGVSGTARFKWFELPQSIAQEGFVCVVEHLTPELVFVRSLTDHANGARAVRTVFAIVRDMDEAFARYHRLPGTKKKSIAVGRAILMRDQQFVVLEPAGFAALFPGAKAPAAPALGGFTLAVDDIAVTRAVLEKAGVPFHYWGDTGLWVPPEHAGGAVVVFAEERPAT
jgi:hypothetical protein